MDGLLVSLKFRALRCANVTDLGFKAHEEMYKSCFRRKDLPMAKITNHWGLHLAVKDAFLGRLVFVCVLLLNK